MLVTRGGLELHTRRRCFALDLKNKPELIQRYRQWHQPENIPAEVSASIRAAGIQQMQIYLVGNRLFMMLDVDDTFDVGRKTELDASNPHVRDWEALMETFQQALPWAKPPDKWLEAECIYTLQNYENLAGSQ